VSPDAAERFERQLAGVSATRLGQVTAEPRLSITATGRVVLAQDLVTLKAAWQAPLDWA
jgi:hypothetical protein